MIERNGKTDNYSHYRLKNGNKYRRPSAAPTVMLAPPSTHSPPQNDRTLAATPNNNTPSAPHTPNVPHSRSSGSIRRALDANGHHHAHAHHHHHHRSSSARHYSVKNRRKRSTDRTTRLLIAILVLFLLTEFPQVSCARTLSNLGCQPKVGIISISLHPLFHTCSRMHLATNGLAFLLSFVRYVPRIRGFFDGSLIGKRKQRVSEGLRGS